jgi:uncharacterized coiled-coil DUF342 family protein
MNSEPETLPNNEQILKAIYELGNELKNLRTEMNSKFDEVNSKFDEVNSKFDEVNSKFEQVDARFEEMRLQMMSFDVRIDRIEALTHKVLNVAFNARADVKVLREEVRLGQKMLRIYN